MKHRMWLGGILAGFLWAVPTTAAGGGVIVRTTLGLQGLQALCLTNNCTVVSTPLDGTLGQLFLVTTALDPATLASTLSGLPGIVDAEVDQLLSLVGGLNQVPNPIPSALLSDRSLVTYGAAQVWNSYANQPASTIVEVQNAQNTFHVTGTGIVADIDTGVDPAHPALAPVLLPGYDFTRNQAGASELNDLTPTDFAVYPPPACTAATCPALATVNQSSAAVLDQSSAAVLDTKTGYAAFGHGTMVMGVIHLVAPTAQLLPLKAFHSDGTGNLSDILRAIYYGVQNNASVINMSFDTKTNSPELKKALDYANQLNVICGASAGNDGQGPPLLVYPAALQNDVMGVASTTNQDTRSTFTNYGNAIVWVAAPGEAIATTYPFSTYAAGWGTSFSAPFVSGGAALLRGLKTTIGEAEAAAAIAHAKALDPSLGLNNGRLDLVPAFQSVTAGSGSPDYSVFAAPASITIAAGDPASYTVSAAPANGFNLAVTWNCTGAPVGATCTVSPSPVKLDGSNVATATVTLTTTARALAPPPQALPRLARRVHPLVMLAMCFACLAVLLILFKLSRASRLRPGLAMAAGLLVIALLTFSCGRGYSSSPAGTPAGTYTLTVTGTSGNLSHATMVQVTVN